MFFHYITVTLRNLARNRFHAFINIFGLALGMACSLVIMLFVYGEWSYDRSFSKADRTYRIGISFFNIGNFANGPERILTDLTQDFPGIETGTRIQKVSSLPLRVGDNAYTQPAFYTDTAFFNVFDFSFASGDPQTALREPHAIVLTETMAEKLFGDTDVVGKTVAVGKDEVPHQITGVVKDPRFNTHLNTSVWVSLQGQLTGDQVWTSAALHTYVVLNENVNRADLDAALGRIFENKVFPESGQPMGFKTVEDYRKSEMAVKFIVHPLKDIYLKSKLYAEMTPGGNESNIYIFSAIAIFILLLAAVNFVNLTTARATRRAKEVGIRKTLGTTRPKLASQFLLESMVTTMLALLLAIVLSEIFMLAFQYVTGTPLQTTIWSHPYTLPWVITFALVVGLLSGVYPAFYLTSFIPVDVLKGKIAAGRGLGFRNFLVVFQFTVAIGLIVGALAIRQQLQFMQTKDLGFDQENVLTVDNHDVLGTSAEVFKNELSNEPGVALSSFHVGEPGSKRVLTFSSYQVPPMEHPIAINTYMGDEFFIPLCGIRFIKGRNFSREIASDTNAIILSESAVRTFGLPEDPIGMKVNEHKEIIGVVSDIHTESLRSAIAPVVFTYSRQPTEIGFKIDGNKIPAFLQKAEAKWKQLAPGEPFRYHFLDDNFAKMIEKEAILGKSITLFTMLAIFISCLGLYGLSAHTAENRTKEIGIRKVLGATVQQIAGLLSREFLLLVGIAFIIAAPLAWFATQQWLEGFAYRTDIQWWMFVLTGLAAVVIALFTLGYQTITAASRNPVESLRSE